MDYYYDWMAYGKLIEAAVFSEVWLRQVGYFFG